MKFLSAPFMTVMGTGMGDLKGVEEKLDYISDLDATESGSCRSCLPQPIINDDTTDYEAVDEAYGTADDFKELASACHEKRYPADH